MNIAIEGCCHGELDQIYNQIEKYEAMFKVTVDVLFICGDFQALRNSNDLDHMHCPEKYKKLGNFYQYYCGNKEPYVTTIIIGGNHEAVNHSRQLYFGGWVAKGIYFLGQSGSIWLNKGNFKMRVTGISGIFNFKDFFNNHLEVFPFETHSDKISSYHYKQSEIFKMQLLGRNTEQQLDVFLSHDWPSNITKFGDLKELLTKKPFFREDIEKGELGCPALKYLEAQLKPSYWFSAHLHVKFPAVHKHQDNRQTHFLALDKCLKNRDYLQIMQFQHSQDIDPKAQVILTHDVDWLTVLKLTESVLLEGGKLYQIKNKELVLTNKVLMQNLCKLFEETKKEIQEKHGDNLVISQSQFKQTTLSGPGNYRISDQVKLNSQTHKILNMIATDPQKYRNILYYNNEKQKPIPIVKAPKHNAEEQGIEGWNPKPQPQQTEQIDLEL